MRSRTLKLVFWRRERGGYTLVEMMVSLSASAVIMGGLLLSSLSIQRAVHASAQYAEAYSDQRRLIDYLTRELRRGIALAVIDASGTRTPLTAGTFTIADPLALVITLPGYYSSDSPQQGSYAAPMTVVATDKQLDYGTSSAAAGLVDVIFRRKFVSSENSICFVREEAGVQAVIVRRADNLWGQLAIQPGGQSCVVSTWFRSLFSTTQPPAVSSDEVLLRNPPGDLRP